jgi:hypothetical protein
MVQLWLANFFKSENWVIILEKGIPILQTRHKALDAKIDYFFLRQNRRALHEKTEVGALLD